MNPAGFRWCGGGQGMKIEFNHWNIEVDVEATRAAYAAIAKGDSEECGCCMCRNFVAQRDRAYPPEVLQLFERLGIDPGKELTNSCVVTAPGKDLYLVLHCFVGSVLPDERRSSDESRSQRIQQIISELQTTTDPGRRQLLLDEGDRLLKSDPLVPESSASLITFVPHNITSRSFPTPSVTVDTNVMLPWVIDHPEPIS